MVMNRRHFLALLASGVGIVAAAPVRRIWAVGATLERPGVSFNLLGKHISRKGNSLVITQRWHESDLVRELQGYPGGGDDRPEASPHIARLAQEMRDALPTTFPTDVRFGKIQTRWHKEDLLYGLSDRLCMSPEMAKYIVCDDAVDVAPIVFRTEIAEGCRP